MEMAVIIIMIIIIGQYLQMEFVVGGMKKDAHQENVAVHLVIAVQVMISVFIIVIQNIVTVKAPMKVFPQMANAGN